MSFVRGFATSSMLLFFIGSTGAQVPPPPPPEDPTRSILKIFSPQTPPDAFPFTIEGQPKTDPGEPLDWDRVYKLALVNARGGRPRPASWLDPKTLDEQAVGVGFADFARFRADFLAQGPARFRDPSAGYFELLALGQSVDQARVNLAELETLLRATRELVKGESSGLTQAQVDEAFGAVQQARLSVIGKQVRYCDRLDEFKVELGLSPQVPLATVRTPLAKFRDAFQEVVRWSVDPRREDAQLETIGAALPDLGDFLMADRSLLEVAGDPPGRLEEFVMYVGRFALASGRAEVQARKETRKLAELAASYRAERVQFVLILRRRSQAQERLLAPPQSGATQGWSLANPVELQRQLLDSQDRLVELWTSYHARRLGLARDLNFLPAGDWPAFYDQILGAKGRPGRLAPGPIAAPAR